MAGLSFLTLSIELVKFLNSPVTIEKVGEALYALQNNKSPRIDGLSLEVFREYNEVLVPELLLVFQDALDGGILPDYDKCKYSNATEIG